MSPYKIIWKRSAVKELKSLPKEIIQKIYRAVTELSDIPFPAGARKLVGSQHSFRIRIGDYRVVYNVESKILTIEIVRVGHRKEIYK